MAIANHRRELGKYLKSKRLAAGLSQGQVSVALGYSSPQFVSNWERGLCSLPLRKLKTLTGLYEISSTEITSVLLKHQRKFLEFAFSNRPARKKSA